MPRQILPIFPQGASGGNNNQTPVGGAVSLSGTAPIVISVSNPTIQVTGVQDDPNPIPALANWESNMRYMGKFHFFMDAGDPAYPGRNSKSSYQTITDNGVYEGDGIWYYDGGWIAEQIYNYTGDDNFINKGMVNWAESPGCYRAWILDEGNFSSGSATHGDVQGWRVFPHGLYYHWLRFGNGDTNHKSYQALQYIYQNAAYSVWYTTSFSQTDIQYTHRAREISYQIQLETVGKKAGFAPRVGNQNIAWLVGKALDTLAYYVANNGAGTGPQNICDNNKYCRIFQIGLLCMALIEYYEEHTADPAIPPAIASACNWLMTGSNGTPGAGESALPFWDQSKKCFRYGTHPAVKNNTTGIITAQDMDANAWNYGNCSASNQLTTGMGDDYGTLVYGSSPGQIAAGKTSSTNPEIHQYGPDLNHLLVAPFGWLYKRETNPTTKAQYRTWGDDIFQGGQGYIKVDTNITLDASANPTSGIGGGCNLTKAKTFSQAFRYSIQYVKWRQTANSSGLVSSAPIVISTNNPALTVTTGTGGFDAANAAYTGVTPKVWLDANFASTMLDGSGSATPNGGVIGTFSDSSGVGASFTQGTNGARPTRVTGVTNNSMTFDVCRFDATDDRLIGNTASEQQVKNVGCVIVAWVGKITTNATNMGLFNIDTPTSGVPRVKGYLLSDSGSGSQWTLEGRRADADTNTQAFSGAGNVYTSNTWGVHFFVFDFANDTWYVYFNKSLKKTQAVTNSTAGLIDDTNTAVGRHYIGSNASGSGFAAKDMRRYVVWTAASAPASGILNQMQTDLVADIGLVI